MTGRDDPLPEQTSDDTDEGWNETPASDEDELRRLLDDRPPHHLDRE